VVRGGWLARPSPLRCRGKAVEGVAMAGACGIRAAALHGTLPPRTFPAVGVSVTTRGDGALRIHAGVPSLAS
jgi:hypothetical protein